MKITFLVIPFIKVYLYNLLQLIHLKRIWGFLGFLYTILYHFFHFYVLGLSNVWQSLFSTSCIIINIIKKELGFFGVF